MYSQQQIEKIKSLVGSYFTDPEVKNTLKSILKQDQLNIQDLDDNQLIDILKKANLMDKLLIDMEQLQEVEQYNKNLKSKVKSREKFDPPLIKSRGIGLKIIEGKAFVEYIQNFDATEKFLIDLNFLQYRFRTQPINVTHEPKFNEEFVFDFNLINEQRTVDLLNLAKLEAQIELVFLVLKNDGTKRVYSIKQIEWRFVLTYGKVNLNIELGAFESNTSLLNNLDSRKRNSVGILQIELDLYPKGNIQLLPERLLNEQLSKERKYKDIDTIGFYEYSSEWWNDYKQIQNTFDKRSIKIYAETEDGVFKPVTSFVRPLFNINGIDSPFHATRFVSLIPIKRREKPGGEKMEVWHRFHTFIAASGGDYEDHANLLCSLLLGFGLDAFVLIGTSSDGPHNWVMTRSYSGNKPKITYWESLTGQRYEQKDPRVNNLYRKIGSAYNHQSFFGNIQNNDSGFHTEFEFENPRLWKKMSEDKLALIPCFQTEVSLLYNPKNPFYEEKKIENELKLHLSQFRNSYSIHSTKFDDTLAHILTTALSNYEYERITGQNFGIEEFKNAIKNYIPENHTFKAFPIQFLFDDSTRIFNKLKSAPICEDILKTRGDQVNFAIKCKMVIYPDDVYVVWISIAVRYFSLD